MGMDGSGEMPFQQNGNDNPWAAATTSGPMLHNGSAVVGHGLNGDSDFDEWMRWDPLSPALSPSQQPPHYADRGMFRLCL